MHPIATYKYTTTNIGDDFQSFAVEQIVGQRTEKVARDRLYSQRTPVRLVGNCWYFVTRPWDTVWARLTGRPLFPPPACVQPLYIGVSIGKRAQRWMLTSEAIDHFRECEPVGCRDLHTLELLRTRGVETWFSGCPTISLENVWGPSTDDIYIVDIDPPVQDRRGLRGLTANLPSRHSPDFRGLIPPKIRGRATEISHFTTVGNNQERRYQMVHKLIEKYATARLVITSRLHVALPCAALGTPCIMLYDGDERLTGYDFLHRIDERTAKNFSWRLEDVSVPDVSQFRRRIRAVVRHFVQTGRVMSLTEMEESLNCPESDNLLAAA
ncbi:MAG: polysaccharide pyruvyl transferase family protein [Planctomycetaceae bacterium]|nr:polysaccharide pyruvyl transferase family protein [Planctomycetaceae bacterium]